MEKIIKKYNILTGTVVFICIPILFYFLGNEVYRSTLKEFFSLLTILSFSLVFSQFFISRINDDIRYGNKVSKILNFHKYLGYTVIAILFLHPLFIVIPRYFEGGINPIDAFWTMITSFDNLGVLFGMISWFLMLLIGITSFLRIKMGWKYKNWKLFHGITSLVFVLLATLHVIKLGRHSEYALSIFFIFLVGISIAKFLMSLGVKSE